MTSPVDGVVLARHVTNERYLAAGTTLLEIGRLEDLEVEADVLSLDVVAAKPGDAGRDLRPGHRSQLPPTAPSSGSIRPASRRSARWASSSSGSR